MPVVFGIAETTTDKLTVINRANKNIKKNKSSQSPHTSAKENLVWIRSPYPDYFQNLTGTSLSKDTSVIE